MPRAPRRKELKASSRTDAQFDDTTARHLVMQIAHEYPQLGRRIAALCLNTGSWIDTLKEVRLLVIEDAARLARL